MYLFFDSETSGLPKRWNAPLTDLSNWPRLVQLAWIVCDESGTELERGYHLVYPDGFTIAPGATRQHGITTAFAREHGEPLAEVMDRFGESLDQVPTVVAHNVGFDLSVVGAEFLRLKRIDQLSPGRRDLHDEGKHASLSLAGQVGFKWPTRELHRKLFDADFRGGSRCVGRLRRMAEVLLSTTRTLGAQGLVACRNA
ncbi:MAG: 3'-5' exonuclease [Pirellulaceae bacterium]